MLHILGIEMKRAFLNKAFLFSVVLGLLLCFIGVYPNLQSGNYSAYDMWFYGISRGQAFFILFVPILSALPYASMLSIERKSGFLKYIFTREKKVNYLVAKGVANAFAGATSLFIPPVFLFIVLKLTISESIESLSLEPSDPMAYLYSQNPDAYILFYCLWIFIQGLFWSTLSYVFSLILRKPFVVLVSPLLYYLFANFAFAIFGFGRFTPPGSFAPYLMDNTSWLSMFSQPIIIAIVSIFLILYYSKVKETLYE
jgi:hypothetical protein